MNDLALHSEFRVAQDLAERIGTFLAAAKAPSTRKRYQSAWRAFEQWCGKLSVDALPATPITVAAYLAEEADRLSVASLALALAAIRQAHEYAHHPSPTSTPEVRTVMQGIRRSLGTAPAKKAPLLVGDVRAIVARLPDDLRGARDRALLLVGFAGGFRRSELVALNVEDVSFTSDGMAVTIKRSKTDQVGAGRTIGIAYGTAKTSCPVTALRTWMALAAITSGAIFRPVDRHGHARKGRLTTKSVAKLVKEMGMLVGLDPKVLAGHSLRSGFASSAAAAGIEERDIARVTGHRSLTVLRGYVQQGTLFDGDVVRRLGL